MHLSKLHNGRAGLRRSLYTSFNLSSLSPGTRGKTGGSIQETPPHVVGGSFNFLSPVMSAPLLLIVIPRPWLELS